MTEQQLNLPDVGAHFKQMDSKGVPEGVWSYRLDNASQWASFVTRVIDGASCNWSTGIGAGKEPFFWTLCPPIAPQDIKELGRQHHVAIFLIFPLFDTDNHPPAVDMVGSKVKCLGNS